MGHTAPHTPHTQHHLSPLLETPPEETQGKGGGDDHLGSIMTMMMDASLAYTHFHHATQAVAPASRETLEKGYRRRSCLCLLCRRLSFRNLPLPLSSPAMRGCRPRFLARPRQHPPSERPLSLLIMINPPRFCSSLALPNVPPPRVGPVALAVFCPTPLCLFPARLCRFVVVKMMRIIEEFTHRGLYNRRCCGDRVAAVNNKR